MDLHFILLVDGTEVVLRKVHPEVLALVEREEQIVLLSGLRLQNDTLLQLGVRGKIVG